jgi:hypothetical protein
MAANISKLQRLYGPRRLLRSLSKILRFFSDPVILIRSAQIFALLRLETPQIHPNNPLIKMNEGSVTRAFKQTEYQTCISQASSGAQVCAAFQISIHSQ